MFWAAINNDCLDPWFHFRLQNNNVLSWWYVLEQIILKLEFFKNKNNSSPTNWLLLETVIRKAGYENLNEMGKVLKKHNVPKFTQEDMENLNKTWTFLYLSKKLNPQFKPTQN